MIDQAIAAGASESQIGALESAQESGELSYERLAELTDLAVECMEQTGVEAFRVQDRVVAGELAVPEFGAREGQGQSESLALELMNQCYVHELGFARMYWGSQPRSQQLIEEALERARDDVEACLESRGYLHDETSDLSGLIDALDRDMDEHSAGAGFTPCYEGVLPGD